MTWFKVDDSLNSHPKWMSIGPEAKALWTTAGSWSAQHLTDGIIGKENIGLLGHMAGLAPGTLDATVAELVNVKGKLWEKKKDGWIFHDWSDWQPSRADVEKRRTTWARDRQLHRDQTTVARVKARDGDHCRYCHVEVSWLDKVSGTGGTLDHIDPHADKGLINDFINVVVACRACNAKKGERTPEQAGMPLLPPWGTGNNPGGVSDDGV